MAAITRCRLCGQDAINLTDLCPWCAVGDCRFDAEHTIRGATAGQMKQHYVANRCEEIYVAWTRRKA